MAIHTTTAGTAKTKWALTRPALTGAAVTDPGTFDEATYPVAIYGFACSSYESVLVRPFFTGSGTVVIETLFYDEETATWIHWLQPAGGNNVTAALHKNEVFELKVFGKTQVFFRVVTPVGAVANLEVTAAPAAARVGGFYK